MVYFISIILIIVSYYIGKVIGMVKGENRAEDKKYYLYSTQIDLYEEGYKNGVRETKETYWMK